MSPPVLLLTPIASKCSMSQRLLAGVKDAEQTESAGLSMNDSTLLLGRFHA